MKKILRWSAIVLVALIVLIQFIPADRTNPAAEAEVFAPDEVKNILRKACFDCHSHETEWPWYSRVAPVSWWMANHVEHGRADLNFSRWPLFNFESQKHLLGEIEEEISQDEMPLKSYRIGHPEARLTDGEKEILLNWARAR
ncbi:MAG: heme-binding domain-containing protein [Acidobacteria bacterium]|uniref:Heme-binding domain-containing protein n=1 Tax=Candidatus Polarisedimenticola svalbardensis TaxID=2886004 RepID=A0A8J6XXZ0_9BACT|nr:heme-binding domain-containing protein [Candidatus Polarisedimenticola svalbardensis]